MGGLTPGKSQPSLPPARTLPLQSTLCCQCPLARRQAHGPLRTFAEFMTGRQRLASVGQLPSSQTLSQKKKTNNTHKTVKNSFQFKSKETSILLLVENQKANWLEDGRHDGAAALCPGWKQMARRAPRAEPTLQGPEPHTAELSSRCKETSSKLRTPLGGKCRW